MFKLQYQNTYQKPIHALAYYLLIDLFIIHNIRGPCAPDKTGYIHHHHHHSVSSTQTLPTLTQRRFYKTQSYQTDFPAKYRTVVYFYV